MLAEHPTTEMDDRDTLASDLPARRDDEPGGLRDDIVDELADHLACAYRRELLRGADGATARRRVLDEFGDPAAVARRLWLEAMWGRIMTQRILVVCCVVLAAVCLAMAALMWNQSVQAQRMLMREMTRAEAARREAEAARQQMLEQLAALSKATDRPQSSGWTPVVFRLTQETPDGPPAVGFHVSLGRGQGGSSKPEAMQRDSDDRGNVDFGVVLPGDWEYRITRDLGGGNDWSAGGNLNVALKDVEMTIVCPKVPPDPTSVRIDIDWPRDLDDPALKLLLGFRHQGFTFQPSIHWDVSSYGIPLGGMAARAETMYVIGGPRAGDVELRGPRRVYLWSSPDRARPGRPGPGLGGTRQHPPARTFDIFADVFNAVSGPERQTEMRGWIPGSYRLDRLMILRRHGQTNFNGHRYDVLAYAKREGSQLSLPIHPVAPDYPSGRRGGFGNFAPYEPGNSPESTASLLPADEHLFEARSGQPNQWRIRIPDELVKAVREKLKAEEAPKK